jgi:hypothetical protein
VNGITVRLSRLTKSLYQCLPSRRHDAHLSQVFLEGRRLPTAAMAQ